MVFLLLFLLACVTGHAQQDIDELAFIMGMETTEDAVSGVSDTTSAGATLPDIRYEKIHRVTTQARTREFHERLGNSSDNFTIIECQSYRDFYTLLYSICNQSILCSEMYYLDIRSSTTTAARLNFRKFVYQLSLSRLFIIENINNYTIEGERDDGASHLFLLEDNVPVAWIPHYIIRIANTTVTPCSVSIDIYASANLSFVYSVTYLLHAYKTYIVNDYRCDHFNQWLVLDSQNRPHCECKHGKSCDTENNYKAIIIVLTIVMMILIILWTVSLFTNTTKLIKRTEQLNRKRGATTPLPPLAPPEQGGDPLESQFRRQRGH